MNGVTAVTGRPGVYFEAFGSLKPGRKHVYIGRVMEHWTGDPSQDVWKCQHSHATETEAHDCGLDMARELAKRSIDQYKSEPDPEEMVRLLAGSVTQFFQENFPEVEGIEWADENGGVTHSLDLRP